VDEFEGVQERRDDLVELGLPWRPPEVAEPGLEALAFLEMQDDVGGIVGPEITIDAVDVGMIEARQRLRFLDEALEPPAIVKVASRAAKSDGKYSLMVTLRSSVSSRAR
jgi:hypothetical protein